MNSISKVNKNTFLVIYKQVVWSLFLQLAELGCCLWSCRKPTVDTLMKCRFQRHFIWVLTDCYCPFKASYKHAIYFNSTNRGYALVLHQYKLGVDLFLMIMKSRKNSHSLINLLVSPCNFKQINLALFQMSLL